MATPTYVPLATITLGSSAATITFSSIPATYRDLILVINGTVVSAGATFINPNGDTSNLSYVRMYGTGSSAASDTGRGGLFTTQSQMIWQFMDYAQTNKHKTFLVRSDAAGNQVVGLAGRWASTTAITSLEIDHSTSNFNSGTTFSLFGVA